jgi:hypothetical protein
MSIVERRMNVPSSHNGEGGTPRRRSRFITAVSTAVRSGGVPATGTPWGSSARNTATFPWYRTITAASPGRCLVVTSPFASTVASSGWFDSSIANRVTSRWLPSL